MLKVSLAQPGYSHLEGVLGVCLGVAVGKGFAARLKLHSSMPPTDKPQK